MLERVSGRHGWWYTPREEWLQRAFDEPDPDLAARYAVSADRTWSYYAGDETLAHWTEEQFKHKLLAIQRGEPTVVGWDAAERECWRCGDDLYRTPTEGLKPDAVLAMLREHVAPPGEPAAPSSPVLHDTVADSWPVAEFTVARDATRTPGATGTAARPAGEASPADPAPPSPPVAAPPTPRDATPASPTPPSPAARDAGTAHLDEPAPGDPHGSPLADVPIVRDDAAFVAGDRHWRAALAAYQAATDDEARYVALVVANALLDAQLLRIHAIHARIGARRFDDPERHAALEWAQTWSTSVDAVRLDETELLDRIGRSRAETLAEEQVKPRLASLRRHAV